MGEGNFSGGGSVSWEITHSDGESGSGHKHGARGKDKHPKDQDGMFVVTVTGHPPIFAPTKGTTVRVIWGQQGALTATANQAKGGKKAAKAKTTG